MSLQPEELIDPREQEFWESDPSILRPPSTAQPDDDPRMVAIGLGIAAAVVGVGLVVRHYLKKKSPQTPEEARGLLMKAWDSTHRHVWKKLVTPSLVAAYEVGAGQMTITPKQLELLASLYADELGDYFHATSVDALVDGFSAQLNKGYNDKIAWGRSAAGYGLDSKQTRGYIIGLIDQPKEAYEPTLVPAASQNAVDKAIMIRADRLGINESYKATQMGRNMVWVYLENEGQLQGASKQWHTAEDERVCPVCAPLDGVTIGLHDQFESANGERFWVPGVHPNCRCWLSLVHGKGIDIAKAMSGDPYDRDYRGRFAENESRKANPIGISRAPIGTRQAALGESRTPLGAATGPLGWARAPIGQERPPIGERPVLGPVKELTLADVLEPPKVKFTQPKIKIQPKVEVENKAKIQTKSKIKNQTKVKAGSKIKSKTEIESPTQTDNPIRFHSQMYASGALLLELLKSKPNVGQLEGKYIDLSEANLYGYYSSQAGNDPVVEVYQDVLSQFVYEPSSLVRVSTMIKTLQEQGYKVDNDKEFKKVVSPLNGANKKTLLNAYDEMMLENPLNTFLFSPELRGVTQGEEIPLQVQSANVREALGRMSTNEIATEYARAAYDHMYGTGSALDFDPTHEHLSTGYNIMALIDGIGQVADTEDVGSNASVARFHRDSPIVVEFPKGWVGDSDDRYGVATPKGLYRVESVSSEPIPMSIRDQAEEGRVSPSGIDFSTALLHASKRETRIRLVPTTDRPPKSEILKFAPRLILRRKWRD